MAQNETLEQLIEEFIELLVIKERDHETIELDEAIQWATKIQDAFNAERGKTGTGPRDLRLMEEEGNHEIG